jgi:hypothetical protein
MAQKPTLIFVPRAWHIPESWVQVVTLLEAQHYKCIICSLASVNSNPHRSLEDDINAVRETIQSELSQSNDVVLVIFSYGDAVGSSPLKGLTQQKHGASGSEKSPAGRIRGMVMLASFFVPTGCTFLTGLGGEFPPWWRPNSDTGLAEIGVDRAELFYHTDLSLEDAKMWAAKTGTHPAAAFIAGGEHIFLEFVVHEYLVKCRILHFPCKDDR